MYFSSSIGALYLSGMIQIYILQCRYGYVPWAFVSRTMTMLVIRISLHDGEGLWVTTACMISAGRQHFHMQEGKWKGFKKTKKKKLGVLVIV